MFYRTGPRLFSTVKASIRAELYSYKTITCLNIINLTEGYNYLKKGEEILIILCNWVLHLSNWQKVQLNTDLFSDMQKYLYTEKWLNENIVRWIGLKVSAF